MEVGIFLIGALFGFLGCAFTHRCDHSKCNTSNTSNTE